jgi:hypothetical protein
MNFSGFAPTKSRAMSYKLHVSRRLLKSWAVITAIWWVIAMGAVANAAARELGPEWCVRYMLVRYMLYLEDGTCAKAAIEPPIAGLGSSSGGKPLSEILRTHYETLNFSDF